MKIVSWNVRGMGRSKRRVIKEKLVTSKADVVILQETKQEVIHRKLIGSIWGVRYTDWVSLPSFGSSGGIIVMWKTKSVLVSEAVVGKFSVSIKIQAIRGQDWWISGVYGPNKVRERDDFWEELAGLYGLCGPRWCVGGDFNVVRFPSEIEEKGCSSNGVTYNTIIRGLIHYSEASRAIGFIHQMVERGFSADASTMELIVGLLSKDEVGLLDGACKKQQLGMAMVLLREMEDKKLDPTIVIFSFLMECLCKAGKV